MMLAIHLIRQIIEYHKARKRDLLLIFVDLNKTYDKVPRELLNGETI